VSGDLVVDLSHSLDLALNLFLVEGVEEDLDVLLTIEGNSGGLASDGGGVALFNILNKKNIENIQRLPKRQRGLR
jgi:hypothetical protein